MPKLVRPLAVTSPMVEHALWWAKFYHRVFPLCSPAMGPHTHLRQVKGEWKDIPCDPKDVGKLPLSGFKWGDKATKDADVIRGWFDKYPNANLGGTPDDGYVWVDVDTEHPEVTFPVTFKQSTSTAYKHHLLYRQPNDPTRQLEQTQPGNAYWPGVDTRAAGKGYVVLSPSVHSNGTRYKVANPVEPKEFPADMVPTRVRTKTRLAGKVDGEKTVDREVVDLLTRVADEPDSPDLGNIAFAKIASRLAKMLPGDLPMFRAWLRATSGALTDPLSDTDLAKLEGIWRKTEDKRLADIAVIVADSERGWLYEMGETGYSTAVGSGDKLEYVAWSNFRVTAKSLVDYGDHQVWVVDFHKADGTTLENVDLPSSVLSSTTRLRAFLVDRGMSLLAPTSDKRGNHGERLLCLLQSQTHERQTVIEKYGWDAALSAFVTPDSLIRTDSVTPANNYLKIKDAQLNYGFKDGAVDVLREFLTFQDEHTMSLFGAFLMVTLLKGHYSWQSPNLAIEAHSGSGKSTYVRMLGQLCGIRRKPGKVTYAVARDTYQLSTNVFNWFDDVEMDPQCQELFRQAATGGSYSIKDRDTGFKERKDIDLHASTVYSAERITFTDQKAMADRFVTVSMPSADTRKSATDPTRSQWHDVDAFFKRTHQEDLTQYAGALVQLALRHADVFNDVETLTTSTSRRGQMVAIMRCGARVLSAILGDPAHTQRVDEWAATFDFAVSPSIVVNKVIPRVWNAARQPLTRLYGTHGLYPVFYNAQTRQFWVWPQQTAEAWLSGPARSDIREASLTDCRAIELELAALGVKLGSPPKTSDGDGKRWTTQVRGKGAITGTYYPIPVAYTEMIYRAATGHNTDDSHGETDD